MGKASRSKGRRAENEFVAKLRFYGFPAKRVSEAGSPGPDVEAFGRQVEVKRRAKLPVTLEKWRRDADIVAMREDLGHWMLYMPVEVFLDILDEAIEGDL